MFDPSKPMSVGLQHLRLNLSRADALNREKALAYVTQRIANAREKLEKTGGVVLSRNADNAIFNMTYSSIDDLIELQLTIAELDALHSALSYRPDLGDKAALDQLVAVHTKTLELLLQESRKGYRGGHSAGREATEVYQMSAYHSSMEEMSRVLNQFGYKFPEEVKNENV